MPASPTAFAATTVLPAGHLTEADPGCWTPIVVVELLVAPPPAAAQQRANAALSETRNHLLALAVTPSPLSPSAATPPYVETGPPAYDPRRWRSGLGLKPTTGRRSCTSTRAPARWSSSSTAFPTRRMATSGSPARSWTAAYRAVRPWLRGYHPDTLVEGRPYDLRDDRLRPDPAARRARRARRGARGPRLGRVHVLVAPRRSTPIALRAIVPIALPNFNHLPRNLGNADRGAPHAGAEDAVGRLAGAPQGLRLPRPALPSLGAALDRRGAGRCLAPGEGGLRRPAVTERGARPLPGAPGSPALRSSNARPTSRRWPSPTPAFPARSSSGAQPTSVMRRSPCSPPATGRTASARTSSSRAWSSSCAIRADR